MGGFNMAIIKQLTIDSLMQYFIIVLSYQLLEFAPL